MPVNKNALLRYSIIDRLVRNKYKPYPTMEEIIEACLEQHSVTSSETIQKDMNHMRRPRPIGYNAPIYFDRKFQGYAYSEPEFSISSLALSSEEVGAIRETLDLVKMISGTSMSEKFNSAMEKVLSITFEDFPEGEKKQAILQTMQPPKARGFEYFELFYSACREKIPVSFVHYSYKKRKFNSIIIHPFLIKEFENKWYIVGYSEKHASIRIFGMDRVYAPILLDKPFIKVANKKTDDYFHTMYGVFPIPKAKKQKIKIRVSSLATNYFQAYPIHESQKIVKFPDGFSNITFQVVPTIELVRLFLSHGKQVQVIEPEWLIDFSTKLF